MSQNKELKAIAKCLEDNAGPIREHNRILLTLRNIQDRKTFRNLVRICRRKCLPAAILTPDIPGTVRELKDAASPFRKTVILADAAEHEPAKCRRHGLLYAFPKSTKEENLELCLFAAQMHCGLIFLTESEEKLSCVPYAQIPLYRILPDEVRPLFG